MTRNVLKPFGLFRVALAAAVGLPVLIVSNAFAQEPPPGPPPAGAQAEVERVIVTGSNIPTAEETGPNPVDVYRQTDIEKLGVRNATDLLNRLPQEAGGTVNQNIANGGDGSVIPSLRGLLPKETLVLLDGKRVATNSNGLGVDINLIPFPMIDHIDILKDGASAIYGADAVAGVINIILKHTFHGLEIGGSIGNTNLGASNDAREDEAWLIAGTGDGKTEIVVIADAYNRQAIFSRDRDISSNANKIDWAGPFADTRSGNFPGRVGNFGLLPFLSAPTPHSAPNAATSPEYRPRSAIPYPDGDFKFFNFAAFTPAIPNADRQSFYGSFERQICDKYLEVFADFKYTRSFFNAELAPTPFVPDPFHTALGATFSPTGISVPTQNAFNPFTVADTFLPAGTAFAGIPVTTGVRYRGLEVGNRVSPTTKHDMLFDVGLKGNMGEFGDYFKNWNWEGGFRYSRNEAINLSEQVVSQPGLREALLDTDPLTAFNPFLNYSGAHVGPPGSGQTQAAISRVYVTLHDTAQFELPLGYLKVNGDLFNLPAGPLSVAVGGEYHGERYRDDPDSLNTTFNTIGSVDFEASKVNRDVWGIYEEVRIPVTSSTWNFPGFHSLEITFAEREEWYSQNTAATSVLGAQHSQYNTQRPKFSVRWEPLDPKWIGALVLRGSYSEGFHAPSVFELSPASSQSFPAIAKDPFSNLTEPQVEERILGNPLLNPEVAYEWTYGAVWSPKWIHGLTLNASWWHIDMRSLVVQLGSAFIIERNLAGLVQRTPPPPGTPDIDTVAYKGPDLGAITLVIDPTKNLAGAVLEGLDYEAVYELETSIFGHGDFGKFTASVNGTWLSRFVLQVTPESKPFNIAGQFVPTSFNLNSSLPRNRAYFSLFYDGPADTWLASFDTGVVAHWTGQYSDDFLEGFTRKVNDWLTFDVIASYTFNLPPPAAQQEVAGYAKDGGKNVRMKDGKDKNVLPVSTAEYNPCGWRAWLDKTKITIGLQNATDEDPPFVAGAFENGYDESLADVRGRFWYVQVQKKF